MAHSSRRVQDGGMQDKESKRSAARGERPDSAQEGRASRSAKHPVGVGPEAGHVVQGEHAENGPDVGPGRERKPGVDVPAGDERLVWGRDPSNPAGSTGQTKPARMYAEDEQEQSAGLARRGVEAAQSELARDAQKAELGKAARNE